MAEVNVTASVAVEVVTKESRCICTVLPAVVLIVLLVVAVVIFDVAAVVITTSIAIAGILR